MYVSYYKLLKFKQLLKIEQFFKTSSYPCFVISTHLFNNNNNENVLISHGESYFLYFMMMVMRFAVIH